MPVQLLLHVAAIDVVGVRAEGVLDLPGYEVERPQDQHLEHHEDGRPHRRRYPRGRDKWHDEPVHHEEALANLGVREWEGNVRYLHGVMEGDHAIPQLLERPRKHGRGYRQHARVDVLHEQALDPGEEQLHLRARALQAPEGLHVDALGVDEAEAEGGDVLGHARSSHVYGLQLGEGDGVQHADQPDEGVPELHDVLLWGGGVTAEGAERAASIKPVCPHLVSRGAPVPESIVGLRGPEDYEEAYQEAKAAPDLRLLQDAVAVRHEVQMAFVQEPAQERAAQGRGQGDEHGGREDAAPQSEQLPGATIPVRNHASLLRAALQVG
mmetsp:Transcript_84134/g.204047  ORF Transcript_84134/g.204047 Transcript_84134/m.204047 type:complete len:324 (+) Transcript_84134:466-1437(+)